MGGIAEDFAAAAARAVTAGFDMLLVDMCHGDLLSSFLSPLSNRRQDGYGGTLPNRMRFPVEVFERVRAAWPEGRPLGARLQAADWARGGFDVDEALAVARALQERGCDLVEVAAGQAIPGGRPDYRRLYLEGGVFRVVTGELTTLAERGKMKDVGDLCLVDPRIYAGG